MTLLQILMENENKDNTLDGLVKAFAYGIPYRNVSSTQQVIIETIAGNALMRTQTGQLSKLNNAQVAGNAQTGRLIEGNQQTRQAVETQTGRLVTENQQTRQAIDTQTETLRREISESQMFTRAQLAKMTEVFQEGSENQVGAIRETGDELRGISSDRRNLKTLISSGEIDETEALALVLRGVIPRDIGEAEVLENLHSWKLQILQSGIVLSPDLKMEKELPVEEKRFLAKIRRALQIPIVQIQSLPILALHGHIAPDVHRQLMKRFREYRHGTEGINYGVGELNTQLDVGNRHLANISDTGRRSLVVAENILEVTGDTATSAREIVLLTRDGNEQRGNIGIHTGEIANNTGIVTRLMEIAGLERGTIRRTTEGLLRNSDIALVQREDIRTATTEIADNTAASVLLQKLVGTEIIDRMDDAQKVRFEQLAATIAGVGIGKAQLLELGNISELLGHAVGTFDGIREGLDDLVDVAEDIDGELEEMNETLRSTALILNQKGTEIVEAINKHGESTTTVLNQKGREITEAIIGYKEAMVLAAQEQKERDLNADKIRADEKLRNGIKLFEKGKIGKALPYFDEAERLDPANFEIYYRRAICYIILEQPDKAEKDLLEALDFLSNDDVSTKTKITMNLAQLYYAKAIVYSQRGEAGDRDSNMTKAIETIEGLIETDQSNTEAVFTLAKYLASHQLLEDATRKIIALLEQHPEYTERIQAEPAFSVILPKLRESLKSNPGSVDEFYYRLAVDYIRENDIDSGLALIENLLRNSPQVLVWEEAYERSELAPVKQRIIQIIIGIIEQDNITKDSKHCFSIASLALAYGISNGVVFKSLKNGLGDSNTERDAIKIKKEIQESAPINHLELLSLLKRHPSVPMIIRKTL